MDENVLEAKEILKEAKKAYIAEIKLDKILKEARNCRERPSELVNFT